MVANGDKWLKEKMNGYYQWAKLHNSLFIVTFDENNDRIRYTGIPIRRAKDLKSKTGFQR